MLEEKEERVNPNRPLVRILTPAALSTSQTTITQRTSLYGPSTIHAELPASDSWPQMSTAHQCSFKILETKLTSLTGAWHRQINNKAAATSSQKIAFGD